jgi:hypothetical protein
MMLQLAEPTQATYLVVLMACPQIIRLVADALALVAPRMPRLMRRQQAMAGALFPDRPFHLPAFQLGTHTKTVQHSKVATKSKYRTLL